jgi:hypothetical protein
MQVGVEKRSTVVECAIRIPLGTIANDGVKLIRKGSRFRLNTLLGNFNKTQLERAMALAPLLFFLQWILLKLALIHDAALAEGACAAVRLKQAGVRCQTLQVQDASHIVILLLITSMNLT